MPSEREKRRLEFDDVAVPIALGDGQEWHFPKPWTSLYPIVENGRVKTLAGKTTFGEAFDRLMDAVRNAADNAASIQAAMDVAVFLLLRNYDLTDAELSDLLQYNPRDETREDLLLAVLGVAAGRGPKPTTDTTDSPS